MRLWSLHPHMLDPRGLVALWREALLAQKVLQGRTKGYTHHPQLTRFRAAADPLAAIADYLRAIHAEALERGYRFDGRKIARVRGAAGIPVTRGQIDYEWAWLLGKVALRDPAWHERLRAVDAPQAHPLFRVVAGGVEPWERPEDATAAVARARASRRASRGA